MTPRRFSRLLFCGLLAVAYGTAWAEGDDPLRFSGSGNGRTPVFETSGPWLLDWRLTTDTLLPARFEMRLHDDAGDYLGLIAQVDELGAGRKLFEQAGRWQIVVVAANVSWELSIAEVDAADAERMRRQVEGTATLEDRARRHMARLPDDSFNQWRAHGDSALLLFDSAGLAFRATFRQPCRGLESATAISFMSGPTLDEYDSILLDDGTRCFFDKVVPTRVE